MCYVFAVFSLNWTCNVSDVTCPGGGQGDGLDVCWGRDGPPPPLPLALPLAVVPRQVERLLAVLRVRHSCAGHRAHAGARTRAGEVEGGAAPAHGRHVGSSVARVVGRPAVSLYYIISALFQIFMLYLPCTCPWSWGWCGSVGWPSSPGTGGAETGCAAS